MKQLMIIGLWPDDAVNYCTEKCDCRRYAFDRILYHRGGRAARERICIPVVDRSGAVTTYLDLPVTLLEAGVVYLRLDDGSDIFLSNTQMALIANEVERQSAKSRKDIPGSRSSICRAIWRTVMKPINAEETVRVFNGWLEEADSLAEREAIERCIDHIQDAPAVSQQELRSYMLPWFSPFAAPWCGKIQRAFPKAYVTMNFELILVPRTNTYINLNHCSTPDEFKAEVIEGVSRFAFKAFTKPLCKEHLDGINKLLDTKFTPEDMEYIYTNLGNGINHELCMKFVKSGYDLKVIEESV